MTTLIPVGILRVMVLRMPADLQRWCQHLLMLRLWTAVRLAGLIRLQTHHRTVKMRKPQYRQPTAGVSNLQLCQPQQSHHNHHHQCCQYNLWYVRHEIQLLWTPYAFPLKPEICLNNIQKYIFTSPKIHCLHYKDQLIDAVYQITLFILRIIWNP